MKIFLKGKMLDLFSYCSVFSYDVISNMEDYNETGVSFLAVPRTSTGLSVVFDKTARILGCKKSFENT
jgi:hypothetical protein